jgi:hypothetical protein
MTGRALTRIIQLHKSVMPSRSTAPLGRNTSADESRSIGDRARRDIAPRQQEHPRAGVRQARL